MALGLLRPRVRKLYKYWNELLTHGALATGVWTKDGWKHPRWWGRLERQQNRELNGKVDKLFLGKFLWFPQQDSTLGCILELVTTTRTCVNPAQQVSVEYLLWPNHREEIGIWKWLQEGSTTLARITTGIVILGDWVSRYTILSSLFLDHLATLPVSLPFLNVYLKGWCGWSFTYLKHLFRISDRFLEISV